MPDLITSLGKAAPAIGLGLGVLQAGIGIVEGIKNKKEQKRLLSLEKAYKTPQEIFDILNATQQNAQSGYDASTLNYLTNQTDQAFSSSLGTAQLLGGDANILSSIFAKKVDAITGIAANNHALQMAEFSQYINAKESVAANLAAEQKSQQDLIKDRLQATGVNLQSSTGNISGGLNTALSALTSAQIQSLYNPDGSLKDNTYSNSNINNNTTGYLPEKTITSKSKGKGVSDLPTQGFQIPQSLLQSLKPLFNYG